MCHAPGVTYRLSMAPRVAQRFGVHLRPHVIALSAFFARRVGILCLVVAAFLLFGLNSHDVDLPVGSVSGAMASDAASGEVTDPTVPAGATVTSPPGAGAMLEVHSPWLIERWLAGAGTALEWACLGVAATWLSPLLRRFAEGEPFAPGNSARLRGIALAVLVATHVAPLLAPLATTVALHRLGMSDDFEPAWGFPVHTSLLFVALLLLLAGALRRGRDLQDDVAGLV